MTEDAKLTAAKIADQVIDDAIIKVKKQIFETPDQIITKLTEDREKLLTLANDYRGKAYALALTIKKLEREKLRSEKRIKELIS